MDKKPAAKNQAPGPRPPRRITAQYLENAALYYLQRHAASVGRFRTVMKRKIDKSCAFHNTETQPFYDIIENMIVRYVKAGLLNDAVVAEGKAGRLRRQGQSSTAIMGKLTALGLGKEDIRRAIDSIDTETQDRLGSDAGGPELIAARRLAQRKKLGRYRQKPLPDDRDERQKQQRREMAAMARAGFGYDIARRALDMDKSEDEDSGIEADFT